MLAISGAEKTGPLTGSLTVEDLILSGDGLGRPIQAPKFTLAADADRLRGTSVSGSRADSQQRKTLRKRWLAPSSFPPAERFRSPSICVSHSRAIRSASRGQASFARARELAQAAGIPGTDALEALAGEPIAVDLTAEGPWMPAEEIPWKFAPVDSIASAEIAPVSEPESSAPAPTTSPAIGAVPEPPVHDTLTGTVIVHNANWKADYLASHVVVNDATLHIENGDLRWDPVDFTYGPLKGNSEA